MIAATFPTTRLCRGPCGRELPIERFRRTWKNRDVREYWCNDCHKSNEKARHRRHSEAALHRFARSAQYQHLDRRLRSLTIATIKRLGGVERTAEMWASAIKEAAAQNPGSRFVTESLCSIARLIQFYSSRPELAPPAPSQMSDEELARAQAKDLLAFIEANPEVAVTAARSLGWTVIPPAS